MVRKITHITIHSSASTFGDAHLIREWHKARGWLDIGYHFVIMNGWTRKNILIESLDGSVSDGRPLDMKPASVKGHNTGHIAIVMIGDGEFTDKQMGSLFKLVNNLRLKFGVELHSIRGHYEYDNGKTCPQIDMIAFRDLLGKING